MKSVGLKKYGLLLIVIIVLLNSSIPLPAQSSFNSEWETYEHLGGEFDASHGIADFDQRQKEEWCLFNGYPYYCGPASIVDVLWYLDCKHDTDGENNWNLVSGVHHPGLVVPLIEEIAQKTKTNVFKASLPGMLKRGIQNYLQQQQMDEYYKVVHIEKPDLIDIQIAVMSSHMVLVNLPGMNAGASGWSYAGGQ